jgi:hypothetical protein
VAEKISWSTRKLSARSRPRAGNLAIRGQNNRLMASKPLAANRCGKRGKAKHRGMANWPFPGTIRRCGGIAQLVEHTTENRGVPGSSPGLAILRARIEVCLGPSARRVRRSGLPAFLQLPPARPGRSAGRQPIEVDLNGRIDSLRGGILTAFEAVPEAPVSKFVLKMQGGKKGLLVNSTNICLGTTRRRSN